MQGLRAPRGAASQRHGCHAGACGARAAPALRGAAPAARRLAAAPARLQPARSRRAVASRAARLRVAAAMFDDLTRGFERAWRTLNDADDLSPANMKAPLRELRTALLEADVALPVVKDFLQKVEARSAGIAVEAGVTPQQQLVKVVNDELTAALGGEASPLAFAPAGPTVILLAGLQGAGKTTAAAKLAALLLRQGRTPLLVATDTFRPAAIDQLVKIGTQAGVPVFQQGTDKRPADIARAGIAEAARTNRDVVIIDTAGRIAIDEALMSELRDVKAAASPHETLLVVDAMSGQDAALAATAFHAGLGLTGAVLTKLDGDARGGAALSVRAACGQPIKFCGVGEKLDDLEPFFPSRTAGRILGMGDVVSLVEKAQSMRNANEMEDIGRRMMSGQFDLNDFLKQSEMMASLGSLGSLARMLPGVGGKVTDKQAAEGEVRMRVYKALIQSMTPEERRKPELLKESKSRAERVARGAGRKLNDVGELLSTHGTMQQQMASLARRMGGVPGAAGLAPGGGLTAPVGRKGKTELWREQQAAAKKGGGGAAGAKVGGFGGGGFGGGGAAKPAPPAKKGFGKKK